MKIHPHWLFVFALMLPQVLVANPAVVSLFLADEPVAAAMGEPRGIEDGMFTLRVREGGGTIDYRFATDNIAYLRFHDEAEVRRAIELWEEDAFAEAAREGVRLLKRRGEYLAILRQEEILWFRTVADWALAAELPHESIAIGELLLPFIADAGERQAAEDQILNGYFHLPIRAEARGLAETWIESRGRGHSSALGYYVLATLELDAGRAEAARDLALKPIVFSSAYPTRWLAECYQVALEASLRMDDEDTAEYLIIEMKEREISLQQKENE